MKPEILPKSIRSFVIRAGRMTEAQARAFEECWSRYGLSLSDGKIRLDEVFAEDKPLVIEIGFGMGDSLLAMAEANPQENYIGIEVHAPGVGRLMNGAKEKDLSNLRVYLADATDVLSHCIDDNSVDRIQVFFPDPWHKKKHNKRRLIRKEFVEAVCAKLKIKGILHLATDWQEYAEQMFEILDACSMLGNTATAAPYSERPSYRPLTKFEARGERLGHGVWDLIFAKIDPDSQ